MQTEMKKRLSGLDVFCVAAGAMISAGLFVLPGLMYPHAGPSIIVGYLLAAVLMLPNVLSEMELATAMPRAGGTYFFIERSLGPLAGTFAGFAEWFSTSLKGAFALVGMGTFAAVLAVHPGEAQMKLIEVGCCVVFVALNLLGVKGAGRLQVAMVVGLLGILVAFVVMGIPDIHARYYSPFVREGASWHVVLMSAGMVFVSYIGVTKVAALGEEVRRPGRDLTAGLLGAFVAVSVLSVLVVGVTVGVGTLSAKEPVLTPISDGAGSFAGGWGRTALAVAALVAFVMTANAAVRGASRSLLAVSRDDLLPGVLASVNRRFHTPHVAILLTGTFMIAVLLFLSVEDLVKTASTLVLLLFMLVNLSVIVMRASRIHSYRPLFRCPGYPWTQMGAILASMFLISEMGPVPLLIACGFTVAGLVWYFVYVRVRVGRHSALVHVVERIMDRRLGTATLEDELKEIVFRRDNIVEDRFDRLVNGCTILDVDGPLSREEFFALVSRDAAGRVGLTAEALFEQFLERERQATTAIAPGLAIPHVVIPGEKKFDMILARSRNGIRFEGSGPPVHVVFVLMGTADERSFHLQALMSIAQIARNADFRERWTSARGEPELRNVILLAARDREAQ